MAKFSLIKEPFLGGFDHDFDGTRLTEVTDMSIVSCAVPLGGEKALATKLKAAGTTYPAPGETTTGKANWTLLGLGADSCLILFPEGTDLGVRAVAKKLGDKAYVTEQSDNWVILTVSGPLALAALERICPLNLSPKSFPVGKVARTMMEHMGTVIHRTGDDSFTLMSGSSSAVSFLHAVETSLKNVT